jgi:hypothetical protein
VDIADHMEVDLDVNILGVPNAHRKGDFVLAMVEEFVVESRIVPKELKWVDFVSLTEEVVVVSMTDAKNRHKKAAIVFLMVGPGVVKFPVVKSLMQDVAFVFDMVGIFFRFFFHFGLIFMKFSFRWRKEMSGKRLS